MKQRLGSDPLSWIRDTRTSQEDANTGERDGTTAAPAPSTNDTNTGERDAASAPAAPTASTNDANTGERDAATAAAPAASTKKANTGERDGTTAARPAAAPVAPAASTKKANTGERTARRKPAQVAQAGPAAPAAQAAQAAPAAQAAQAGPAGPAAQANDTNTGELPGEEALRALIARELAGMAPRRGRPRTNLREVTKSSQEGLPENWTRATFIVRETLLEDLKDCAYTRRKTIRDVLDEALTAYLSGQELLRRPR